MDETRILVPLLAGLFAQTKFNTSLNPLSTEVRRVKHRTVLAEEFLEHPRELLRQGQDERLAILDDAGGHVHFLLVELDPRPHDLFHGSSAASGLVAESESGVEVDRHLGAELFELGSLDEPLTGIGLIAHREVRDVSDLALPLGEGEHTAESGEVSVASWTSNPILFLSLRDKAP